MKKMLKKIPIHHKKMLYPLVLPTLGTAVAFGIILNIANVISPPFVYQKNEALILDGLNKPTLDTFAYDTKLLSLAHIATSSPWYTFFLTGEVPSVATTTATSTSIKIPHELWPVKQSYPEYGALLPFNRILAYYGNFYSTRMGVLGEYGEEEVLTKLQAEKINWENADPSTPVIPAIEYIAVTAQGAPGEDGTYRLRMPDSQIDKAIAMAEKINGIVILDIQIGKSTLKEEIPLLEKYLSLPKIHLALDPEFSMKGSEPPGRVIGTHSADDINYAIDYLSELVIKNNLPPKILVVHRFTLPMITNYKHIRPTAQVQVVIDMDGWGPVNKKIGTYNHVIYPEPVQFTGIKIFYHNDLKEPSTGLMTPQEALELTPAPSFIQYQ